MFRNHSIVYEVKKMEELWDAYFDDGTLAGCDLVRGERIPQGLRHLVAEVFVVHKDGSILLTRRDFKKSIYPGYWESGAGGAVIKGESALEGAKRELFEETGIESNQLKEVYHIVSETTIYYGYLCVTDCPKDSIRLQDGETIDYCWVDKQEFVEIFHSDCFVDSLRERLQDYVKCNL